MPRLAGIRRAFHLAIGRRARADVDEEFAFHLDRRAGELMAQGWAPDAARDEARRRFGDLEDAKTYCRARDERLENRKMRTELMQDLRFALRTLRKAPAFTAVAALTLALGIGANTAIFSVVRGILLRPLPFAEPSRLVTVGASYNGGRFVPYASPTNIEDWRTMNRSFTSLVPYAAHSAVLTGAGDPEQLRGYDVGADFFPVLGVSPVRGRLAFTADEAAWQGTKSVFVHETLWRTRFGADPSLVGSTVTLGNERYLVQGIVPAASAFPAGAMVWFPYTFDPAALAGMRGAVFVNTVGRLKPGVTLDAARGDMEQVSARLERDYPNVNVGLRARVLSLQESVTGSIERPLYVLLGGVAFVLLIACANVANLTLVRGVSREGELAVRTALGAGRGRITRQLVTESLLLSFLGAALGLVLAVVGTKLLVAAAPQSIPRLGEIRVDGLVLAFTFATAVVTGVVFGLVPARQAQRRDVARTLREAGRGDGARSAGRRARRALVTAEMALSVMLLAGAGLLIRSFERLTSVDPGFRTDHAMTFALSLPDAKYGTPEKKTVFVDELLARLKALPGVQSAGVALAVPLTPFRFNFSFGIAGRPTPRPEDEPSAEVRVATPTFLPSLGIPLKAGRGITDADRDGAPNVFLVTEAGAKRFFPGENPIGKHVTFGWAGPHGPLEGEIVGIVGDVKQISLADAALPQFYVPFAQRPVQSFTVVMHTEREPQTVLSGARGAVKDLDPDLAVSRARSLDDVLAESVAQPRFYMLLLTAFAVVAVLLSAIGIYGVIAYLVGQRSREIGIRMALGATAGDVVRLMLGEGAVMAAIGLALGVAGALALSRSMTALLFGISGTDPLTYAGVTLVLGVIALVASGVPALGAARVDPAKAIRAD